MLTTPTQHAHLSHIKAMESQLSAGQVNHAYASLIQAAKSCPKYEFENRDKIAKWLLNFSEIFVEENRHHDALSAVQIAQTYSVLHSQIASEMIEFLEGYIETHHQYLAEITKRENATKADDLDAFAQASSEKSKFALINENRSNPLKARKTDYLDYPSYVDIETLAVCNAACTFCPYPNIERQGTRMPDQMIEKIIEDLTEIPPNVRFDIAPYKVSDPFIEKRLLDIIGLVDQKLPNATISLISNGSTMTEKALKRLADQSNINYLRLSLNDHRKAEYEMLMSLPFERTLDRLDMLHKMIEKGSFPHTVVVNRVMEGNRHDIDFMNFCKDRYPLMRAGLSARNDWIGSIDEESSSPVTPNIACKRWYTMSIIATGDVCLCCMDGNGEWLIGNVKENSVLDIYNSKRYRNLREHTRSRINAASPCNECTYI